MSRFGHHRAPLHLAVLKNRADMVRLLLELGADARAKDSRGYTPLNFVTATSRPGDRRPADRGGADPAERGSNRFEHLVPVLNVADLARSLAYYVDGLGFEKQWEYGEPPTFAAIRRDQVQIFLSQEDPKRLAGIAVDLRAGRRCALCRLPAVAAPSSCGRRPTFPGACAAWTSRIPTAIACA